jgi:hypothetical protein
VSAEAAPYEALLEHAERELELAGRGDVAGLVALGARWQQLAAGLDAAPPRAAAGAIEKARLIHERTRIELLRLRDSLFADFATADTAKRAAGGYGGTVPTGRRLDRSA